MTAQPATLAPPFTDRRGKVHQTTRFHWYHRQNAQAAMLAICPVCNCGPCAPDCEEQALPAEPRAPRTEQVSIPLIGTGDPQALIRAAFAEAARLKQVAREEGED